MSTVSSAFNLSGRRALVTGSSRGIGAAIALGLAEAGADVAIHYAGAPEPAGEIVERIRRLGRRAVKAAADFSDPDAPSRLITTITEAWGGLDIIVSNVAVQYPDDWRKITREQFDIQAMINWRSAFELIQCAAPPMLDRGWGRILTIGSVQENKPHPHMLVYASLKAAQTLMVRNLARQFASSGVTVNNLAPGVILTDRNTERLADSAYADRIRASIPAGDFGKPTDCAAAALLLCSDAGRYITGQNLFVDGGMSL
jgi:NAD(P)-dependent dehydrogenase (short-subunit alcohol dehydrogenase family)